MREPRKRNQKTKERIKTEKMTRLTRQKRHEHQAFRRGIAGTLRNRRMELTEEDTFPQDDAYDE